MSINKVSVVIVREGLKILSEGNVIRGYGVDKPTTKISIRLPEIMIDELKLLANKRDIPYQSLLKMFLSEKIDEELHSN